MMRFSLQPENFYAMELLSSEFGKQVRTYSPIKVYSVAPAGDGSRRFDLSFYHAAYPEGVQNKVYTIQTIERSANFLLGRVLGTDRVILVMDLTDVWLHKHFDDKAVRSFLQENNLK
ncbi:hypothetical protein [Marinobacter sp. AN1]|uniref:hypothetical protein n=1 Tax=Marinobacter sp. AN1 TaxID=2886046 RepID=UPI00222E49C8|nr:hypothetical protein [Marinobacter sp. AN1]UZD64623.1 hypothetical protein LJ360_13505 [Marinobacter sp. AN1]